MPGKPETVAVWPNVGIYQSPVRDWVVLYVRCRQKRDAELAQRMLEWSYGTTLIMHPHALDNPWRAPRNAWVATVCLPDAEQVQRAVVLLRDAMGLPRPFQDVGT